jgi:hypothetical protein
MSPREAFQRAMFWVSCLSSRRFDKKPGAVIEQMHESDRAELRKLTIEDVNPDPNLRPDLLKELCPGDDQYYQSKEFEKDLLEFDKKILKNGTGSRFKKYDS